MTKVVRSTLLVGLEVHVELATRSKMFCRAPNPACPEFGDAEPNTLIDPVVLGLPGALPVMNKAALDMAMSVGLALGCQVAEHTKWDRKNYFYPDLPKAYQISQYDLPICFDGAVDAPIGEPGAPGGEPAPKRVGIIRAHLEEDAGKLLHEAPGGRAIDFSIVDYNRAGTPLLEIVTQPDFRSADEVVRFAQLLRHICRWLGVTEGVMQKGHMRFEPNINLHMELDDGRLIKTPVVEIKNLNSFRAVKGAIEFEQMDQPRRWMEDGRVMGPGAKTTRGWDEARGCTVVQREKEDAHEYRYFPDPDLVPVNIDERWRESVRAALPELPHVRERRHREEYALSAKEAAALNDERANSDYFEACVEELAARGVLRDGAGKKAANVLLQSGAKRANERGVIFSRLGPAPAQVAALLQLREDGKIGSSAMDELFGLLCDGPAGADPETIARERGLIQVSDPGAVDKWVDAVLANPANAKSVEAYKGGKTTAIGALVGAVMKESKGQADAKLVKEALERRLA
ncbi:MAG: Asp-tRNA(Asn)/Glu-tRNA(Gln) amidotransferase subunit GatB [Phycisphaerales bacterium]|nr:Asp-tRNA(Asn)/Glu-tRNA(Gln) amidotransferase subunit GatB [Phycisphaerales bacterium]